jgi:putative ABC transport system permease protein
MKFLPLVWAGIWRKPGRAILTLLSVANAFLLFGILQGFASGLNHAVGDTQADVLLTFSRVSQVEPLPLSTVDRIRTAPGVRAATPVILLISTYRTPTQFVPAEGVDPKAIAAVFPGLDVPPNMIDALQHTRTGALVGRNMATRFGWKVGDRVPLRAAIRNHDGSQTWPVDIVGIFPSNGRALFAGAMLLNYQYIDEGRASGNGTSNMFIVRVNDPKRAGEVATNIDRMFANSVNETKTATVRQIAQDQIKQLGDIGFVINAIVGAVFFALLFSVGALMMQSVRERTPELAVLKTLGFTDGGLMGLILSESLAFCIVSAAVGLGLAALLFPVARQLIGFNVQTGPLMLVGFGLAVALALISGLPPAVRAMRLQVVDALAGR